MGLDMYLTGKKFVMDASLDLQVLLPQGGGSGAMAHKSAGAVTVENFVKSGGGASGCLGRAIAGIDSRIIEIGDGRKGLGK